MVCGSLTFEEAQPSYAPTPEAGLPLEPFDCTVNFHPVQVMKTDDEDYYSVMQLDPASGEYEEVYDLEHLITEDGHINAVDLWLDGDKYYVAGSVKNDEDEDSKLCFFDSEGKVCYDEALNEVKANAGCILNDNFYYAKDLGEGERSVYWVEGIGSSEPVFHSKDDAAFVVDENLYVKSVLDFVGISETVNEFIDDGEEERSYLVGLGQGFEVVVIRLEDDGTPESYAVLESAVGCDDFNSLGQPVDCADFNEWYEDEEDLWTWSQYRGEEAPQPERIYVVEERADDYDDVFPCLLMGAAVVMAGGIGVGFVLGLLYASQRRRPVQATLYRVASKEVDAKGLADLALAEVV